MGAIEEKMREELIGELGLTNVRVQRDRRIFADVPEEKFREVFDYAVKGMNFLILGAITGLDEGDKFSFIYHISREDGIVLNLKISLPREKPVLNTITGYFPCAEIYERELEDLLGAKVMGLSAGKRYPLPDDWPKGEFPLRKDWKPDASKKEEAGKNA